MCRVAFHLGLKGEEELLRGVGYGCSPGLGL